VKPRGRNDGSSLRAARYALENVTTLRVAASMFGCTVGSVSQTWRRVFPDVPALVARRRGHAAQAWPEDEVTL
jgi:hypothetical protein